MKKLMNSLPMLLCGISLLIVLLLSSSFKGNSTRILPPGNQVVCELVSLNPTVPEGTDSMLMYVYPVKTSEDPSNNDVKLQVVWNAKGNPMGKKMISNKSFKRQSTYYKQYVKKLSGTTDQSPQAYSLMIGTGNLGPQKCIYLCLNLDTQQMYYTYRNCVQGGINEINTEVLRDSIGKCPPCWVNFTLDQHLGNNVNKAATLSK